MFGLRLFGLDAPALLEATEEKTRLFGLDAQLLFDAAKEFASTLIVVTHDVNIAKQFTRVITINDGILEETL